MNRLIVVLLVLPVSLWAQTNRYFVTFKDKANSIYSVANPSQFLSQKSIDRRALENFQTTADDFPVNANYVQQVKTTGAGVFFSSRWFNGLLIQTTPTIAATVSNLSCVLSVDLVAPGSRLIGGRTKANENLESVATSSNQVNQAQNAMIGLDKMHAAGFYGEEIDIAIFDAGFNGADTLSAFKQVYKEGRIKSAFNFVQNSANVYAGYPHGTWVFSIMAGNKVNQYQGGVPNANYFLYLTEDANSEYRVEEYNWLFAAEKADSAGVDVVNSSLGYSEFDDPTMNYTYADMDGKTTVIARAARKLIDRGVVVVSAAGNEGDGSWRYITSPADVDGILACGAVDVSRSRVSFSSFGPSVDGRIKPDVSAMGGGCLVIDEDGGIFTGSGTSFASPLVASLAAGLRQAFPKATAGAIYSLIVNSSSQGLHPDNLLGYGIPDFGKAKELVGQVEIFPNPVTTSSGIRIGFDYSTGQVANLVLYSASGQKVFEGSAVVASLKYPYIIDSSTLSAGLYYLRVQTIFGAKTVRILKVN